VLNSLHFLLLVLILLDQVDRAILGVSGKTDMKIIGNTISNLRQPAYFNGGNTGDVIDNYVTNTRGWVVCGDSKMSFTGNTFGTNAVDIAIIPNNNTINNYGTTPQEIIAISESNNGAYVENQLSKISAKDGELYKTVSLTSGVTTEYFSTIEAAINLANEGDTIEVAAGTYNLTEALNLGKSISMIGADANTTIIDVSGLSTSYAFPLANNANLSVKNITFKGSYDILGFRASSKTHVDKLEIINCTFEDFKYPIYLAERYDNDATDAENKVGTLIIKGNDFVNVSESGYAAYIGRGVVESASIQENLVIGGKRGFQIFDCRGEIGEKVPRANGLVVIANNTFSDIDQWPIDLMIGGSAFITGNNVIAADLDEVPVVVLRDTDPDIVKSYSGNKVNGIEVSLREREFEHESSPNRELWLYYYTTTNSEMMGLMADFVEEEPLIDDKEEPEELDITPLDTAIEAAKVAKEGITVSEDGTDVPAGTYWVAQADMDTLDEAIAAAVAAKETAETQQDVVEAVEELELAISTFNDSKQEAMDEEEIEEAGEGEELEE
jgi:hypothetical protein